MATKNRLAAHRAANLAAFVALVLLALTYAATNSGTPAPPVPLGTPTSAATGTHAQRGTPVREPSATTSGTPPAPTYTRRPTRTNTATNTPTASATPAATIMVWWYIPHVVLSGSATPYPTPTREVIPPGATMRPTSTYAPTPTPATVTPYPAPATNTPRPTATQFRPTRTPVPIAAQPQTPSGTSYTYIMSVSVYVPMSGPENDWIDGNACYGKPWEDCFVQTGDAACGFGWPKGTIFILQEDMAAHGLPSRVVCRDRGNLVFNGNLDLALVSADSGTDLKTARAWGRRRVVVRVVVP